MDPNQANIAALITETINTLFSNLFSSIDNNLYSILDDLVFIKPDIIHIPYLSGILESSTVSGVVLIANSLVAGFLIYYSIAYLLSHFITYQLQKPYQFIFRLIVCTLFINYSYFICEQALSANSTISLAIRSFGEDTFGHPICFASLIENLNSAVYLNDNSFNIFSIDGLLKGIISFGLLNLLLSYALRYVLTIVFVLISPFAFLSLILQNTSWIFKAWLKMFLSLLLLQILVPVILLVSFAFSSNTTDTFSKLVYIGSIYALIQANNYLRQFMGGLSTDVNAGMAGINSTLSKNM